jgi:Ca-activated chloride channel family protein
MGAVAPAPAMYRRDAFTGEARCIQMPPEPPQDPVTALLAKQLASGMWDEPAEAPVKATIRALLFLLKHDVTSAHPLHGAQVKKAVEALVARAVVSPDKAPDVCALALAVAWLISSGPRSRGTIANLVDTNAAFASLKGRLDETSLRADLDRLAGLAAM